MCGTLLLTAFTLCASVGANASQLTQSETSYVFSNGQLSLTLDEATGAWTGLSVEGQAIAFSPSDRQSFDLKQGDDWLTGPGTATPRLLSVIQEGEGGLVVAVELGRWRLDFTYTLPAEGTLLSRSVALTWYGDEPTRLKGFWMATPRCMAAAESYYYLPGNYPPARWEASSFTEGRQRATGKSLAPVIAQLTPRRSVLWITDALSPDADRGSATVKEHVGGVTVSQAFDSQAIVRPGDTQRIGEACMWVLPTDGEGALLRIHDWMRQRGHVPPADRPEWLRDAILYSFHPGGTIGSNFKDLGGFEPATDLLDDIQELGANAIWIMPIEDAGVYHPRDYYKFQEGLGTEEQYRALVARAHELGMHVLQDCVPHGGRNDYPRAKEHPEWLAYNEDGSTLDYWCYDFNWPTWRQYMAQVARHYVTQFGVDGFRVDAVGGSRIPNWNPDIPYARASLAQLQGGLNMLRSLREAVKEEKPEVGGLLAEVEGSAYGTVSDAVYDFTGCYTVYHDLRKLPPGEFVARLRRWLHEQQFSEVPDLLRLRHIESHDSLRSELWYGLKPQRALMALTAWIHGIPLIYHEMEAASSAFWLPRMLELRTSLPELNGGAADYLCVQAPPEVFACLRSAGDRTSVVLINFSGDRVKGEVVVPKASLPAAVAADPRILEGYWSDDERPAEGSDTELRMPLDLDPFEFTVYALRRRGDFGDLPPYIGDFFWPLPGTEKTPAPPLEGAVGIGGAGYHAWVDRSSGLLRKMEAKAWQNVEPIDVLGPLDVLLPAQLARQPAEVTVTQDEAGAVHCIRAYPGATLEMTYRPDGQELVVETRWSGESLPDHAALCVPVVRSGIWSAGSAEGLASGTTPMRRRAMDAVAGGIYRLPQGGGFIWDSAQHPFGLGRYPGGVGSALVALEMEPTAPPARVQWLQGMGDRREPTAILAWRDPDAPYGPPGDAFSFRIRPHGTLWERDWAVVKPVGGGWELENASYCLRLGRSGALTELRTKGRRAQVIVRGGDVYTDGGFAADRTRFSAGDDVEAYCRMWQEGENIHMRFEGQLRGFGRFDLLKPPIDYVMGYEFGNGPSFRMSCAVKPQAAPHGDFAFLSTMLPLPQMTSSRFAAGEQVLVEGEIGDGSARVGQTALLQVPALPDKVTVEGESGRLLNLTQIEYGGQRIPRNVFVHGQNLFLAWEDGEPSHSAGAWSWLSAVCTPGEAEPQPVGGPPYLRSEPAQEGLLHDGGFEQSLSRRLVSVVKGDVLPLASPAGGWQVPAGGQAATEPVHEGAAAAEVVNTSGDYLLWRQSLPLGELREGSKWRLSAWVKGQDIVRGEPAWKVGCLRFAVVTDKTTYASCPELIGTFDWRQVEAELTIPEGVKAVSVEAGLNGAVGRMWIDEVRLRKAN